MSPRDNELCLDIDTGKQGESEMHISQYLPNWSTFACNHFFDSLLHALQYTIHDIFLLITLSETLSIKCYIYLIINCALNTKKKKSWLSFILINSLTQQHKIP